jgi:ATP-dependent Clp protease adaptor protein ClpS
MPSEIITPETETVEATDLENLWQVVLLDDDDHTYEYVIVMLMEIFGHPQDLAYQLTCEVDSTGRVVVDVTTREKAEAGQKRILDYGPDPLLSRSRGSMNALIEPVE